MSQQPIYQSNTVARQYTFTDLNNAVYDPDTITITIKDANDATAASQSKANLTRISTGIYQMQYNIPSNGALGVWTITVNATSTASSLNSTQVFDFNVQPQP